MKTDQLLWENKSSIETILNDIEKKANANLIFVFGDRIHFENEQDWLPYVKETYPNAEIVSGTTSGTITNEEIIDQKLCITAIDFEKSQIKVISQRVGENDQETNIGTQIGEELATDDLKHIILLCDGFHVRSENLLQGINEKTDGSVKITGGLVASLDDIRKTLVGHNNLPTERNIVAIGFYGDSIRIKHDIHGGWKAFGPKRLVTKSEKKVLYELDGKNVLELYKKYLGGRTEDLPTSALRFPLCVHVESQSEQLVRAIVDVNEEDQSMMFGGDIPEGSYVQLMKGSYSEIINGLYDTNIRTSEGDINPQLTFVTSCVGRRMVLGERTEEEMESIREQVGVDSAVLGFYSFGEFSPSKRGKSSYLHNQTLVLTIFAE
ncbi:MAG: FIST C-terminal domain-containing protein [Crocinitomicaceae bacterium]|nr:FIST C-terminal domain-containing protein [Crocinitomicaceae bacterium]